MSLRRRIMDILQRSELSAHEKIVGIVILLHADKEGVAWPGTATLLRLTSIKRKETVFAATAGLEADGVLVRERRAGAATRYRFLPMHVIDSVIEAYNEQKTGTENRTGTVSDTSTENRTSTETRTGTVDVGNRYGLCGSTGTENRTLTNIEQVERESTPSRQALSSGSSSLRQGSEQSESSAPTVSGPHFNGVGFVVRPGVYIPHATIEAWRVQFPNLNIRNKVERLGRTLAAKNPTFWGLQDPEAWMRLILEEDNSKAVPPPTKKPAMQTFKR